MSTTKTAGTGIAYRSLRPEQFPREAGIPAGSANGLSLAITGAAGAGMNGLFGDTFTEELGLSGDESRELELFGAFLAQHVQRNGCFDVQCMLLWNEWVRTFRRQVSGFPGLIREKEFRSAMIDGFGAGVAVDGWRGEVFLGVRFVP